MPESTGASKHQTTSGVRRPLSENGLIGTGLRSHIRIRPLSLTSMESLANIRPATHQDTVVVSDILKEAARWLEESEMPLWREGELEPASIAAHVAEGLFFIAECSGNAAGVVRFQLEDPVFSPDVPQGEAAYIHRLAVRRRYAGTGLSTALLRWAVERTQSLGRRYLRLDCVASRPRLRAVYESFGFQHRDDKQVGPYFVSRYEYDVGAR